MLESVPSTMAQQPVARKKEQTAACYARTNNMMIPHP